MRAAAPNNDHKTPPHSAESHSTARNTDSRNHASSVISVFREHLVSCKTPMSSSPMPFQKPIDHTPRSRLRGLLPTSQPWFLWLEISRWIIGPIAPVNSLNFTALPGIEPFSIARRSLRMISRMESRCSNDSRRGAPPTSVYSAGPEPNARFSLANERIFLA